MDWTKAKVILIGALVVTNIILITAVAITKVKLDDALQVTRETVQMLKSKNITISAELPTKKMKMPVLMVKYSSYNQEEANNIMQKLEVPKDYDDSQEAAIEVAEKFLRECGFMSKNVEINTCSKENGEYLITYKNVLEEKNIEPSYMICRVLKGKVVAFQRNWLTPVDYGPTKKQTVLATTALMKFFSEKEDDLPVNIDSISMVYWLDSSYVNPETTQSDTAFPAWRITYNGGKETFIPAYDIN